MHYTHGSLGSRTPPNSWHQEPLSTLRGQTLNLLPQVSLSKTLYINWHTIYKGTIYKLVHWYTCIQGTVYKLVHWYTCIHEYMEMHTPSNSDPLPFTEECAIKIQNKCSFALLFPFPRVGSLFFAKKLCKDKLPQYLQVVPRHKVYSLEPTLSALMCNIFVVRVTFCAIRPLAYLLQSFSKNSRRYYTVFESS